MNNVYPQTDRRCVICGKPLYNNQAIETIMYGGVACQAHSACNVGLNQVIDESKPIQKAGGVFETTPQWERVMVNGQKVWQDKGAN